MQPLTDARRLLRDIDHDAAGTAAQARATFPADLPVLAGHFPSRPVVPGVSQLGLIHALAEHLNGGHLVMHRISKAKWPAMLGPEMMVQIAIRCSNRGDDVQVTGTVSHGDETTCQATILLARP